MDEIAAEQLLFYRGPSDVTSTSVPNGISNTSKSRKGGSENGGHKHIFAYPTIMNTLMVFCM